VREEQQIYLIGFTIASDSDEPNFFALYVCCGENDRPIAIEGEILLFQKPELAASILMKSDDVDKDKFKSEISQALLESCCNMYPMIHIAS
jgi:hypothetical protein